MNIEEYKCAMNEITVKPVDINTVIRYRFDKIIKYKPFKLVPTITTIIMLSFILVLFSHLYKNNSVISITVYAKEKGEIGLTKDYVKMNADASFFIGSSSMDVNGNYTDSIVNYNLNFICEGKNIKSITYACSDQNVLRNTRKKDSIYYVENITTTGDEFYRLHKEDNFISGFLNPESKEAYLTYIVGNSYTVLYDAQTENQYGLVVPAEVDEYGNYHVKDVVIKVTIQMKDGSRVNKKIKIHFSKNAYSLEVKILR